MKFREATVSVLFWMMFENLIILNLYIMSYNVTVLRIYFEYDRRSLTVKWGIYADYISSYYEL